MTALVPLLNVEDVSESIAFYQRVLDASVENRFEIGGRVRWARLRCGDFELMLNQPDGASSAARASRGDFADAIFYLFVGDAPGLREKLAAEGLAVGELQTEEYGAREFTLRDPDGYALRFSSAI